MTVREDGDSGGVGGNDGAYDDACLLILSVLICLPFVQGIKFFTGEVLFSDGYQDTGEHFFRGVHGMARSYSSELPGTKGKVLPKDTVEKQLYLGNQHEVILRSPGVKTICDAGRAPLSPDVTHKPGTLKLSSQGVSFPFQYRRCDSRKTQSRNCGVQKPSKQHRRI